MNKKIKNEIYSNRFVREIVYCLYKRFSSDTRWGKFRISCCKRLLELATYSIRHELKQSEEYYAKLDDEKMKGGESEDIVNFTCNGLDCRFYLPHARYDLIQGFIKQNHVFFENELLNHVKNKYLQPDMVYLDCGANIGNHTIFFLKAAAAKKIYAFEGNPDTYKILKHNISINDNESHILSYNCVLGEEEGKADIDIYDPFNLGCTSFQKAREGIDMYPLDSFDFKEKIDFVKMDVERFEYHVLQGMKKILEKDKPILWIEIFPENITKVEGVLHAFGYKKAESLEEDNYIYLA